VVDNASLDGTKTILKERHPNIIYIRLEENLGSAGGYYLGIKEAVQGSDFVWTLDDDVRLNADSLERLLGGIQKLEPFYKVGAVRSTGEKHFASEPTRLEIFPWRGTLIKTKVIIEIGLPRQEYFLYGEDLEYALRFARNGYLCFWIPASKCVERRDDGKKKSKILTRQFKVYATPFRLYYAFRNEVAIYKEYRDVYRLFKTLLYAAKLTLYFSFCRNGDASNQVKAIFVGIKDGLIGALGINRGYQPIPE
jgi:rhamnopyranosyl-N-acetylglucosaminyl-diphospho-decaprenol beta-1,3/1,4-galactofuranosyltransferase